MKSWCLQSYTLNNVLAYMQSCYKVANGAKTADQDDSSTEITTNTWINLFAKLYTVLYLASSAQEIFSHAMRRDQ